MGRKRRVRDWQVERIHAILSAFADSPVLEQLEPPLSIRSVRAFERRFAVKLPEDYVDSLTAISAGGWMVDVFPPEDEIKVDQRIPVGMRDEPPASYSTTLRKAFPLTKRTECDKGPAWSAYRRATNDAGRSKANKMERAIEKKHAYRRWGDGMLTLKHDGCDTYNILVVTGKARGQVWTYQVGGEADLMSPVRDYQDEWSLTGSYGYVQERPSSFAHWYLSSLRHMGLDELVRK